MKHKATTIGQKIAQKKGLVPTTVSFTPKQVWEKEPWYWILGESPQKKPDANAIKEMAQKTGFSEADVRRSISNAFDGKELVFLNGIYQVAVRHIGGDPHFVHLSIKRKDRGACHDWRDFQRIKNEIVGPEYEAIELYPAESRVVDTANQYHLWVLYEEGKRITMGWDEGRPVTLDSSCGDAKQRERNEARTITPMLKRYGHLLKIG